MKERRLSSIDHITFCILYVLYGKRVPTSWSSARHEPFTRFKTPQTLPRNLTWHAFTPLSIFQWLSDLSRADWLRAMVDESFYKCLKHSPATSCSTWILNILTSFLWSIRVHTIENCCRFVKYPLLTKRLVNMAGYWPSWVLYTFLGTCPPTPAQGQHYFSLRTKCWFRGRMGWQLPRNVWSTWSMKAYYLVKRNCRFSRDCWPKVSYFFTYISGYHQATCPYKPQWEKYRQKTFSRNVPCCKRTKGKRAFTSALFNS